MRNADVANLLDRFASLLELKGDQPFRVNAYRQAAQNIRQAAVDVAELAREGRLTEIRGVGTSIAEKVDTYLRTGHSSYLAELESQVPLGALDLMRVPGVGPHRSRQLAERAGIQSVDALIREAEAHHLQDLPGIGPMLEANLLREARRVVARSWRIPLFIAWPLAELMARQLARHPAIAHAEPVGSIRRGKETVGDIDVLLATTDASAAFRHAAGLSNVQEVILQGPAKCSVLTRDHWQVDLWAVEPHRWGASLQAFTGSKAHNIHLRTLAMGRDLKLNEYGLFRADGSRLAGETEAGVYEALGLAWIPPELREDRGEIEAAAAGRLPALVTLADIRGDSHTHTTFSDGRDSLEAMAEAARQRHYDWLLVTDHSYGLTIAKGLTKAKALQQRQEIAALNRRMAPFRILQGVELEIRLDGSLDFDDSFLATFDMVGASVHTGTAQGAAVNTARLLGAVKNPFVEMLNHPTGGIVGSRAPYEVDIERVINAAIVSGTALEINGSQRLDLSSELAWRARERGAVFSLSSDAHSVAELDGMRYAVLLARRAWIDGAHVLNVRDTETLLGFGRAA